VKPFYLSKPFYLPSTQLVPLHAAAADRPSASAGTGGAIGPEVVEVRRVVVRALANLASQPSQHAAVVRGVYTG
jgi:hypothetical protein